MNRSLSKILTVVIIGLTSSLPISADQEYLEVENFNGIEINTGIIGTVSCGDKNTVTLEGDKRDLDKIEVSIHSGKLAISRHTSAGKILTNIFSNDERSHTIRVEILTTEPLSTISGATGSSIKVPGCAIDSNSVTVEAGTGASVNIEGSTQTLELDLSTGSEFNHRGSNLKVNTAMVDLSTGASANLCGAAIIDGKASMGASIRASKLAQTDGISLYFGADVHKGSCR